MLDQFKQEFTCPSCQTAFSVSSSKKIPKYCPYCSSSIEDPSMAGSSIDESVSMVQEHLPPKEKIQFSIGPYQILDTIGKGGMGEVFLAYDTTCGRRIALKRIRPDLMPHTKIHKRFIREARITSQLTHPAIIPIYQIQNEEALKYYTMPFVEGKTLRQILSEAHEQEEKGLKQSHVSSIPALVRLFLSVCQAIAYAHSKGIIHRDIKPNNIIVGQYGQVLILDWGLAKVYTTTAEENGDHLEELEEKTIPELTNLGRVVGTLAYMAPERAAGNAATFQTDIYSLGVILYQILTLRIPFHRRSLDHFRKTMAKEVLVEPSEEAPYRDVPPLLSNIAMKAISPLVENRYHSVDELIHDLESYLEGRSEWLKSAQLNISHKSDWEFQEHVLLAQHTAITRRTEASEWVNLMISKASFSGNIKIEAKVNISDHGHGIGFLFSIPESNERSHINAGYTLWIAPENNPSTKLLRSGAEVIDAPEVYLKRNTWQQIRIEQIENHIHFYLNDVLQFSYLSHLPLRGTHVGLLARDANFKIEELNVFTGSQNINVNCLAIPDAFLAYKQFAHAIQEYKRIALSFPGTAEAREAQFRAGITLLEEAKEIGLANGGLKKAEEALEEFGLLHGTPGAPLQYLGKALTYQLLGDYEEEIKCFELAYRRYPDHPLLSILQEQLIHRLHDVSRYDRTAAYHFVLLAIRYFPDFSSSMNAQRLFQSLKNNWEQLYFIEEDDLPPSVPDYSIAIPLAFWLAKPYALVEMIDQMLSLPHPLHVSISNALFALIVLGETELAKEKIEAIRQSYEQLDPEIKKPLESSLKAVEMAFYDSNAQKKVTLSKRPRLAELRVIFYWMDQAIAHQDFNQVDALAYQLRGSELSLDTLLHLDAYRLWAYLFEKKWKEAEEIFQRYSVEQLASENSPLHVLYGCWLLATEGKEIGLIYLYSILEIAYPRTWILLSHFIQRSEADLQHWLQKAFPWEKKQLYRQFALFHRSCGDETQAQHYLKPQA